MISETSMTAKCNKVLLDNNVSISNISEASPGF
jgi:hypothetical protein